MDGDDTLDHVDSWLEEGTPLEQRTDDGVLLPVEEPRELHGDPQWWANDLSPEEEILAESPATMRRERDRDFSEQWGWIWDLSSALYYWLASYWTADVALGLLRASYGVLMLALLFGIIYCSFYAANAPTRTLPTIDELMKPAVVPEEDGSLNPMDGPK